MATELEMTTLDAKQRALRRANEVRRQRAQLKKALRKKEIAAADLLVAPPEFLQSAAVGELLQALPGYGRVRVERLLRCCGVSPLKTIGGLTERQRTALVRALSIPR